MNTIIKAVAWAIILGCIGAGALLMSGCTVYARGKGPVAEAPKMLAMAGLDAKRIEIPDELLMEGVNHSKAFIKAADTVKEMFDSWLIYKGLVYSLGKYYGHEGKVVDSATTIELEKLRNAKSVADAEAQLKILQAMPAL